MAIFGAKATKAVEIGSSSDNPTVARKLLAETILLFMILDGMNSGREVVDRYYEY
jgi:hypothetical protein